MTYNLIDERWIPVRRRSASRERIAPWEITDTGPARDDPWVMLDAPRPDFNGALIQFLIGLVQTATPPATDREWRARLVRPPAPSELKSEFVKVRQAYELFGDGPRFLQDLDLPDGKEQAIDALLIDSPGEHTLEKNGDHFVKRGRIAALCPACAATALFTLQTNAPSGGSGHRTSLRGGGPLTTIILGDDLWQTVWLNVLRSDRFNTAPRPPSDVAIFPWTASTRTSERGQLTTPADGHPLQVFWGMPRRIRLDGPRAAGLCDLCGATADVLSTYNTKNYGINYKGGWLHPLTPYSRKEGQEPNPRKGSSDGASYRHWLGLVQSDPSNGREPAQTVHEFFHRAGWAEIHESLRRGPRLWAFGYEMDNMKPCGWYEGTVPLSTVPEGSRLAYEELVGRLVRVADFVSSCTRQQIKKALFRRPADRGDLPTIAQRFWADTETNFYTTLRRARDLLGADLTELKREWLTTLVREADRLFDELSQTGLFDGVDPKRIAVAHRDLHVFTSARAKKVREILDLPAPGLGDKRSHKSTRGKTSRKEQKAP